MLRRMFLVTFTLSTLVHASSAVAEAPVNDAQVIHAVERALEYVQAESASWLATRTCAACHHAPLVVWSVAEAQRRGYKVDGEFLSGTVESILGSPDRLIATKLFNGPNDPPDPRPLAKGVKIGAAFMGAAAGMLATLSDAQKQTVRSIGDHIVEKQREDGSWEFFLSRPPINENETTDSVWLILALDASIAADGPSSHRAARDKAAAWLDQVMLPDTLQDHVFKLWLAARTGQPAQRVQPLVDAVFSRQRDDGGWGQLADLPSDAYATGQVLYVLGQTGTPRDNARIDRALALLVGTQQDDGSWKMASRSSPDGKPGSSKLLTPITCAAGCWATLGMTQFVSKTPP